MNETDETLYARYLREGDNEDLRVLLERHRERLTLFLYGYVQNMEDAEELMLDAFAVAAARTSIWAGRSSFRTWLFGIGRHLALRQLKRRRKTSCQEAEEYGDSPEMGLLRGEEKRQLYAALERLNPEYRQALYLVFFEDMSAEDAARVMGRPENRSTI